MSHFTTELKNIIPYITEHDISTAKSVRDTLAKHRIAYVPRHNALGFAQSVARDYELEDERTRLAVQLDLTDIVLFEEFDTFLSDEFEGFLQDSPKEKLTVVIKNDYADYMAMMPQTLIVAHKLLANGHTVLIPCTKDEYDVFQDMTRIIEEELGGDE